MLSSRSTPFKPSIGNPCGRSVNPLVPYGHIAREANGHEEPGLRRINVTGTRDRSKYGLTVINDLIFRCCETAGRPAEATLDLRSARKKWSGRFRPLEIKTPCKNNKTGDIREDSALEE